jgi:hypothetical protein
MSISVGGYVFNSRTSVVREQYEVVGGKQTRAIRITGLLRGAVDEAALIDALDDLTAAVSTDESVAVSLRPGRQIFARREGFAREVNGQTLTGQFVLDLRAETAWEESEILHEAAWIIGLSGATLDVENAGNAMARPIISLTAEDVLIAPGISDGVRTLVYEGNVDHGSTLVVDAESREVRLDGTVVTGYTSGDFPQLSPGETTLTYLDDPGSSHLVTASVTHRDRWW